MLSSYKERPESFEQLLVAFWSLVIEKVRTPTSQIFILLAKIGGYGDRDLRGRLPHSVF